MKGIRSIKAISAGSISPTLHFFIPLSALPYKIICYLRGNFTRFCPLLSGWLCRSIKATAVQVHQL